MIRHGFYYLYLIVEVDLPQQAVHYAMHVGPKVKRTQPFHALPVHFR